MRRVSDARLAINDVWKIASHRKLVFQNSPNSRMPRLSLWQALYKATQYSLIIKITNLDQDIFRHRMVLAQRRYITIHKTFIHHNDSPAYQACTQVTPPVVHHRLLLTKTMSRKLHLMLMGHHLMVTQHHLESKIPDLTVSPPVFQVNTVWTNYLLLSQLFSNWPRAGSRLPAV